MRQLQHHFGFHEQTYQYGELYDIAMHHQLAVICQNVDHCAAHHTDKEKHHHASISDVNG